MSFHEYNADHALRKLTRFRTLPQVNTVNDGITIMHVFFTWFIEIWRLIIQDKKNVQRNKFYHSIGRNYCILKNSIFIL